MADSSDVSVLLPIAAHIYMVRGQTVMLDSDLAEVYGVETKAMNRAVRRNSNRFPEQFAFQLLQDEWDNLRCQIGTSSSAHGGRRYCPWVFTEHGAVMLATVLNSVRAVQASIAVVEAFVRLRHALHFNKELAWKIDKLGAQVDDHQKSISVIFHELGELTKGLEPEEPEERIGFKPSKT